MPRTARARMRLHDDNRPPQRENQLQHEPVPDVPNWEALVASWGEWTARGIASFEEARS